ncbi:MAG: PAP2 family protein [Bacteroidetes bacterium]|nr:PAP2 family protein [Bacteroidota bacterium]
MEDRIARVLTILFHPLFIPFYILLVLIFGNFYHSFILPEKAKYLLIGLVFLTTVLFPLLIVFLFYRVKLIKSFQLFSKEERIYPLLVAAVFYYLTYYLLKRFPVSFIFSYYMLGSTFLTICALIISFYRKISLHMIGIGGMIGLFMGLSMNLGLDLTWFLVPAILLAGMLGFARLKSNSHKPSEVYSGFLVGAGILFLLFIFL